MYQVVMILNKNKAMMNKICEQKETDRSLTTSL